MRLITISTAAVGLTVPMIQIHFSSCPDQREVISLVEYYGDEHSVML